MPRYSRRMVLALTAGALVSGCAVPRGAAHRSEILAGADRPLAPGEMPEFSLRSVTRASLPELQAWPSEGTLPRTSWPAGGARATSPVIAPGDRLDLRIWDSEATSLITAQGAQVTDMPGLTVSATGRIFLPYIDEVEVAGLTPDAARRRIQDRLEQIIPSAQVQLSFASGRQNSVEMVSGVAAPGSYPLQEASPGILSLISAAGGVPSGLNNPQVRLMRANTIHEIALSEIYADPARDIPLRGRDRVIIAPDERYFIALGAAGREEVVTFTTSELNALRAVSMMGGMSDARADPRGILILRHYPPHLVGGPGRPPSERVVFSLDLTNADGLFSAQQFLIRSGDVVLATQAPATTAQRVFALMGGAFGLGRTVAAGI